jgi:hypothetical protein
MIEYQNWTKIEQEANRTVRLAGQNHPWLEFKCEVIEQTGHSAKLLVPEMRGTW